MRILIVDDDENLLEILAEWFEHFEPGTKIHTATCLDQAVTWIPAVDGVLCDGEFPTHANECRGLPETRNWAGVALRCHEVGVPFVLLSGNDHQVRRCRQVSELSEAGPKIMAFSKPMEVGAACVALIECTKANLATS